MSRTKLSPQANIYVPDKASMTEALRRTTHLAVGAHQDDLEIFSYHGISSCYEKKNLWYTGVVVTDGCGSPRAGKFAKFTNEKMTQVRTEEQKKAAEIGKYSCVIQLLHPSQEIKKSPRELVVRDLKWIFEKTQPEVVYLHNLFDKHDTHVATALAAIEAMRDLRPEFLPKKVYGCEVWRDLDWVNDEQKIILSTSEHPKLAEHLLSVFESQIAGGKKYDLATLGRRLANATFHESTQTDKVSSATFALDLLPLITNPKVSFIDWVKLPIRNFEEDVLKRIKKMGGN